LGEVTLEASRFLLVGLGNPGTKYENTRHNIGFQVIDELSNRWSAGAFQKKFRALSVESSRDSVKALLLKPQTYMNLSGESVQEAVSFFKIPVETHLLVISDDIDLPPGALRIRLSGGAGGHNGLKSIAECLGTENYARLRIGVGRSPTLPADVHVLAVIPKEERELYKNTVTQAADAVETILKDGLQKAMNTFNQRKNP
jgi:PTH1 family peptidyl-tRNA hydrolase